MGSWPPIDHEFSQSGAATGSGLHRCASAMFAWTLACPAQRCSCIFQKRIGLCLIAWISAFETLLIFFESSATTIIWYRSLSAFGCWSILFDPLALWNESILHRWVNEQMTLTSKQVLKLDSLHSSLVSSFGLGSTFPFGGFLQSLGLQTEITLFICSRSNEIVEISLNPLVGFDVENKNHWSTRSYVYIYNLYMYL